MIKCSLLPQLNFLEKLKLADFLIETLNNPDLSGEYPSLLNGRIYIYVDGSAYILKTGSWEWGSNTLYLAGHYEDTVSHETQLAVLLMLTQLCETSETLTKASSSATVRYLTKQYQEAQGLIVSGSESAGIAFNSKDMSAAACIGGEWMLPSGETVDVSGPEWTVSATTVTPPATPEQDVEF